mgnify:CR=1 FL=1
MWFCNSIFIDCLPSSYLISQACSASALYLAFNLDVILETKAACSCALFLAGLCPSMVADLFFCVSTPALRPSWYFFSQAFNASFLYLFLRSAMVWSCSF